MSSKKLLLILIAVLLIAGVLAILLTPFAVATGLRFWIARTAQHEGLRIEFGKIEAPLLSPVIIHNLQAESERDSAFQIKIESPRVELALNLSALFSSTGGHVLRSLTTDGVSIGIRNNPKAPSQRFPWRMLADLRADNFRLSRLQFHLENGESVVDLEDGALSGSQIEAGVFSAAEITIVSPLFRKSFAQLRGTTSWQDNRLSIGALTLTRGLDIDSINIDLSQIADSRFGLEVNLDAFGGKLRTSISSDDHADQRTWDVVGRASEVSLAQLSEALDFTECAGGSVHACNFSFRGETTNLRQATATIWAEVTGLTWRDRTADTIIIGASLYNRQIQIEQVFVKQRANQLTLTGESVLPEKLSDWLNPDFRGDISASIDDLGDFARLFGAHRSDFAGKIKIEGNVSARERKLGGQLTVSGNSLTVFRAPVESMDLKLNLQGSELEIANIELCQKNDVFRGQAKVDLAQGGSYSGQFTASIAEAANYVDLLPESLRSVPFGGNLSLDWTAKGDESGHSGTFHVRGHGLHPRDSSIVPFNADIEAEYAPGKIFLRQCSLTNSHISLSAIVTVANDYLQLQSLQLELNGSQKVRGDVFLPISIWQLGNNAWLTALNDNPVFDVDLNLDPVDLAELARAISTQPKFSGQAMGNLRIQGPIGSLDAKSTGRLQDFVFGNEPRITATWESQLIQGMLQGKANALAQGSDPIDLEWSVPYRFDKQESTYLVKTGEPFSATLNFPAALIAKMPRYLTGGLFIDGILSGRLAFSGSPFEPQIAGEVQMINGRLLGGPAVSTKLVFQGRSAKIDFARITKTNFRNLSPYGTRGEMDFRDLANVAVRLVPDSPLAVLTPLEPSDCINAMEFSSATVPGSHHERIGEVTLRGDVSSWEWTISFSERTIEDPIELLLKGGPVKTYPLCGALNPTGHTLTFGIAQPSFP